MADVRKQNPFDPYSKVRGPHSSIKRRLTESQAKELWGMTQVQGWDILLDLMEQECIAQELILVNADAADEKKVVAEHKISKAFWLFFVRIQRKVAFEIGEMLGQLPENAPDPSEESPLEQLLSAIQTGAIE